MHSVLKGTIFTIAARWTDRAIGFVSMVILARILAPADFGLVTLAWIVVGLADVIFDFGGQIQLIQNKNADREDFDSTWTFRILLSLASFLLLFLAAPLASTYYHDARVADIIRVVAFSVVINSVVNIGIISWIKEMRFDLEFRFQFMRRIVGFVVTLVSVMIFKNYWGLVIGTLTSQLTGLILSYVLNPYRPKFCLTRINTIWRMSVWLLVRSIGVYGNSQADKLALGRVATPGTVGAYNLADELASLPTSELLAPFARALFPSFAKDQNDHAKLAATLVMATAIAGLIVLPAAIGLAHVADLAIPVLLGPKWLEAIPILKFLCFCSLVSSFSSASGNLLLAVGKVRAATLVVYLQVGVFVSLVLCLPFDDKIMAVIVAKLIATCIGSAALVYLAMQHIQRLRLRDFLIRLWRPALSTLVMKAVLLALPTVADVALVQLGFLVLCGGVSYMLCVILLWQLAGKPEGVESYILQRVLPLLLRRSAAR